jgi:ssDNA-binding Zn-finger/Zn-ribbon topoisomerase 1
LSKNKSPRFFCDNCGREVGHQVKACPYCGRFFASVRCPACDFTGAEKLFLNGCPLCGYSAVPVNPVKIKKPRAKKPPRKTEPVPILTYIIAGLVLLILVALLSRFM